MKYIDISVAIRPDLPVWSGDPAVSVYRASSIAAGDEANITRLDMGAHTATHVDAPLHFLDGRRSVDQLDLEVLIGSVWVAAFDVPGEISVADLEQAGIPAGTVRLLLKTRNSRLWSEKPSTFDTEFVGLSLEGARWLVEHGVRLVGIDYLGVERYDSVLRGAPVHRTLLDAEVILLEGLNLSAVQPGAHQLICLPVIIQGADGAPCRAVLLQQE
ncbi:cyclase family protein [bacterium]|nr:MAG: cyclase family protein [bacterium]